MVALFVVVSPLLAFAVYFGLWHTWGQTQGLVIGAARVRRVGVPGRSSASAMKLAIIGTAAAFGSASAITVALAVALCLTVPHTLSAIRAHVSSASMLPFRDRDRPTLVQ